MVIFPQKALSPFGKISKTYTALILGFVLSVKYGSKTAIEILMSFKADGSSFLSEFYKKRIFMQLRNDDDL